MSVARLAPRFVEEMPEPLEAGVLFVSLEHRSMLHLCACGCGTEVALPLTPLDWRLTYDGEDVSVWPSVGSWSLPCRSHYVIDGGRVRWASDWSEQEIAAGRRRDRRRRGMDPIAKVDPVAKPNAPSTAAPSPDRDDRQSSLAIARRWLSRLWKGD